MSGDSKIEELRQLVEQKVATVKWWKEDVERYTKRIEENTGSHLMLYGWSNQLELMEQLKLRKEATANAEAALQVLELELTKSDETGVITEAGLAAVNAEKEAKEAVAEAEAKWLEQRKRGGMATRKKYYRRRNKRKTKHYKKKTKRYTKKRNMRY